jgi:hypothetical protein
MYYIYKGTFNVVDAHYNEIYVKAAFLMLVSINKTGFSKRMKQTPDEHFTQKNIGSSICVCG